jgi:transcriptional regulator with XRE-family HTH domain
MADVGNRELDRLAGLKPGHSWLLEHRDDPNPELRTLQGLAGAYGVPVGYLAAGEGKEPTQRSVRAAIDAARARYSGAEQSTGTDGKR